MRRYSYKNFLPAKTLNLSGPEKAAMVRILKKLDSGKIIDEREHADDQQFDMSNVFERRGRCGSVGCIAGYMAADLRRRKDRRSHDGLYRSLQARSDALANLVSAEGDGQTQGQWMHGAKAKHGASAIRNFLRTGKADWRKAMGKDA